MLCYAKYSMQGMGCNTLRFRGKKEKKRKKKKKKKKQGYRAIQKTGKHEHGIRKRPNMGYECNANQTPHRKKKANQRPSKS